MTMQTHPYSTQQQSIVAALQDSYTYSSWCVHICIYRYRSAVAALCRGPSTTAACPQACEDDETSEHRLQSVG